MDFETLQSVNTSINAIPYVATPGAGEPVDYWTYQPEPGRSWVCRDYTQAKAEKLREMGVPASAMTVVLCWTEAYGNPQAREYHAVLAVQDGADTWILDSRFDQIYRLNQPPADYRWDRRQVAGSTDFLPIV